MPNNLPSRVLFFRIQSELAEELTNELLVLLGLLVIFLPLFFEIFVYGAPYRSLVNLALF
jgi:hypothetical protein